MRKFQMEKSGEVVSVYTAIGFNVKRLWASVSVKKFYLKCQNFRITVSSNYSKNLGKILPKFSLSKLTVTYDYFSDIYLKRLITQLFLKIFPKCRKNFLKIACFKSFLTVPSNFLRISEHMSISSEFRNTYKFSQNFRIPFSSNYSPC